MASKLVLDVAMRASLAVTVSVAALATAQAAHAQAAPCEDGTPGPVCVVNVDADRGPIVGSGSVTIVNNSATISGAPAISLGGSAVLFVNNEADGTITGTGGVAIAAAPRLIFGVDNSGIINGNVVVNDAPAPNAFTAAAIYYISDGGTLNGNLQLGTSGFSVSNFIQRGADDGVTGTISAGAGIDIYTRSYTTSRAIVLGSNVLPNTFEFEGFEVLGPNTTLTLSGTGTSVNFSGNGAVVNTGTINPLDAAPLFPPGVVIIPPAVSYYQFQAAVFPRSGIQLGTPGSFFVLNFGNALASFTNGAAGQINGDINISTAAFANAGAINLVTRGNGSTIFNAADRAFTFDNSGSIAMSVNGARLPTVLGEFETGLAAAIRLRSAVNTTGPADVTISNSGSIIGGLDVKMAADRFVFENTGSIEGIDNPGSYYTPGLVLGVGELSLVSGMNPSTHFDAPSATIINAAGASIDHNVRALLSAFEVRFENHGFIAGSDADPDALYIEQYLDADDVDATSFTFVNSGAFEGNIDLELQTSSVNFTNSGDISAVGLVPDATTFPDIMFGGRTALSIDNDPIGDQAVTFVNSGTITNTTKAGLGVRIELDNNDDTGSKAANLNVTNSGTISATGGATIVTRQFAPFLADGQFLVNAVAGLAVDASDVANSTINIENTAGGLIQAGGTLSFATPTGYNAIANTMPGTFTVALAAAGRTINIVNSGTIRGGPGTQFGANAVLQIELRDNYLAGAIQTAGDEIIVPGGEIYIASIDTLTNTVTGTIIGSIDLGGGDDTILNQGAITGDIYLRDGDDALANYGSLTGNVFFGAGNDTFRQGINAVFTGIADGQDGEDRFILDLTGGGVIDQTIYDRLINFELFSLIGEGQVDVALGDDDDNFQNDGVLDGQVNLGSGDNEFVNTGTVTGGVAGGEGDDIVRSEGQIIGGIALGDGANQLINDGIVTGDLTAGSGDDTVQNGGQITGDIDLGDGANQFANAGAITGNVATGGGDDQVANSGTITGDVNLDAFGDAGGDFGEDPEEVAQFARFSAFAVEPLEAVAASGGNDVFANSGTLNGSVFTGGGTDTVSNTGTIAGTVNLGDGDDILNLADNWTVGDGISGGTGSDLVNLTMGQSQPIDLSSFSSFETLKLTGSLGILSGTADFAQIDIIEGRLIGSAGSQITGNVAVASGATFGSAGTVTGNISVASGATLSPGASPAIMNVIGNVSLAAGSTTVFEFVPLPGQSDQLIIDGNLSIAQGAQINLVGNRPRTPGVIYDLIIADSITGEFTIGTWDRQLVQGFLRYFDGASDDRLQLLGTFVLQGEASPQAQRAIDYVNTLLVDGTAPTALLLSVDDLIGTDGFASSAAFAQLTPEPYASATQLAVESGLSLAKISRGGFAKGTGETAGLFGFGEIFGNWRSLDADAASGTSRATNRNYGVFGGIGFGSKTASIGAFAGYLEGRQRISALGAETSTDGLAAGLAGHFGSGAFDLDALLAYTWSDAETSRVLPGSQTGEAAYDLDNLVLDVGATYALDLGGWTLVPGVGVTHVSVRRGGTRETGSPAFGLDVERDSHSATFLDAAIGIRGSASAKLRPSARIGVREQVQGERVFASAGLLGSAARFSAPGAPRSSTVVTLNAGLEASLSENVSLSVSYDGEFGDGTGTVASAGIRARF